MRREEGGHPFLLSKGTVPRVLMYQEKGGGSLGGYPFLLDKGTVTRVLMYKKKRGK
jgi:hypothetical protein